MKKYIILISLLFFSCSQNQLDSNYINPVKLKKATAPLSEYADDIQYIPLSFDVPIRHIQKIDFCDNYIFVAVGQEGVLIYRSDGSFYKRVARKGKGPGEFNVSINSFAIDRVNKLIYMLSSGPEAKIMVYSFNGEFKYEFSNIKLNGIFQQIALLNNKIYLFEIIIAGSGTYNWVEMDLYGNVLFVKMNSVPVFKTMSTVFVHPIYLFNNGIGYWNQYNDTIFRIEDNSYTARFYFEEGEHRLPFDNSTVLDNYFKVRQILESKKNVWIIEIKDPSYDVIIMDKRSETSNSFKNGKIAKAGLIDDLGGGINIIPMSYSCINEQEVLVSWSNSYTLKQYLNSETFKKSKPKYPEKKKELEELANSLNENDNPVMMLVKLKS